MNLLQKPSGFAKTFWSALLTRWRGFSDSATSFNEPPSSQPLCLSRSSHWRMVPPLSEFLVMMSLILNSKHLCFGFQAKSQVNPTWAWDTYWRAIEEVKPMFSVSIPSSTSWAETSSAEEFGDFRGRFSLNQLEAFCNTSPIIESRFIIFFFRYFLQEEKVG